jgi:hypothetical protein
MIPKDYSLGRQRFIECLIWPLGRDALRLFDTSSQRRSPRSLLALMLGFAVFLWGVQYKLSLYCSEATQRTIPAAKLLSETEQLISSAQLNRFLAVGRPLSIATRKPIHGASIAATEDVRLSHFVRSVEMWQQFYQAATCFPRLIQSNPRAPPITV